ncbi:hypothetical protein ACFY36_02495 [Actinoplanes sp. NPDC000266]
MGLAGCSPFSSSATSGSEPADTNWVNAFVADAQRGGSADTSVLSTAQFSELESDLPSLACCIKSVAHQLDAVNPVWGVTPSAIEQFLDDWCHVGVSHSVGRMFATIPGADLRALPALNQTLSLIQRTCRYDPAELDWTSGQFVAFTTGNSPSSAVRPVAAPPERSSAMQATFSAICGVLNDGLSGWIAKRVRAAKANFFVTIAMEAAFTFCPGAMDRVLPR